MAHTPFYLLCVVVVGICLLQGASGSTTTSPDGGITALDDITTEADDIGQDLSPLDDSESVFSDLDDIGNGTNSTTAIAENATTTASDLTTITSAPDQPTTTNTTSDTTTTTTTVATTTISAPTEAPTEPTIPPPPETHCIDYLSNQTACCLNPECSFCLNETNYEGSCLPIDDCPLLNQTDNCTATPIPPTEAPSSGNTTVTTTTLAPAAGGDSDGQRFDGASFIGGIILCGGVVALMFFGLKFYKSKKETNYHTL